MSDALGSQGILTMVEVMRLLGSDLQGSKAEEGERDFGSQISWDL